MRNQDFDTNWIEDLRYDQIEEIVFTLHTYGYITYKKQKDNSYLCRLTPEGMKFCQSGGFKEQKKKNNGRK